MSKFLQKLLESIEFIFHNSGKKMYLFNVHKPLYVFLLRMLGFKIRNFNGFYSENGQDIIILNYFGKILQEVNNGLFVDVGANHPIKGSNSFFFERYLGFFTVAVEPIVKYQELWEKHRTNSEFYNVAISKTTQIINFTLYDGDNNEDMFSGISVTGDKYHGTTSTIQVQSLPLSEVIGSRDCDFCILSIDVEGTELDVVKTIDFKKLTPSIIIAENNESLWGNEELRKFIINQGYSYFGRIWNLDDIFIKQ